MDSLNQKQVLFIGLVWPEPTSSAAGYRIVQLVREFASKGYKVHFASSAQPSKRSYTFEKDIKTHQIVLNDSSFDVLISELTPDVVVFDRFLSEEQFGWRVRKHCPQAVTILDTEDLHFLRKARQVAYKKNEDIDIYTNDTKRELASIYRTDLSLIISKYECKLLKDLGVHKSKICYLPFIAPKLEKASFDCLPNFESRLDFMFIGNFLHEPNVQTVSELKHKYWELIRKKLPKTKLYIYGAYPTQKVLNWHNPKQGFFIEGAVDCVDEVMKKHRVLLAPIPFGAGIKGKFFDAFQNKLPSVVTEVGAEAMKNKKWAGLTTTTLDEFVQASVKLYSNQNSWDTSVCVGMKMFNKQFSNAKFARKFFSKLAKINSSVIEHRKRNFIGEILYQQQFMATKYMSLWIEEKHKS